MKNTAARWPISEPHNSKVAVFSSAKIAEQNFKSLLRFLSHGMEFRAVFLFLEMLWNKIRKFASISVQSYEILSIFFFRGMVRKRILIIFCSAEQMKFRRKYCSHCFVYSVFRGIIFYRKFLPTLGMREGCGKEKTIFTYSSIPLMLKGK